MLSIQNGLAFDQMNRVKPKIPLLDRLSLLAFSLIYSVVLQSLPILGFMDRQNYLNYAQNSVAILARYANEGVLSVLANEPLWLLINIAFAQFFEAEIVLRLIIFLGAFLFSYSLLKINPRNSIWLVAFLLMPYLLKNHITHLRQGLAMALFYWGYFSHRPIKRWMFVLSAPFVHSSFIFILPIVVLSELLKKVRFAVDIRMVVYMGFAILVVLGLEIAASMLGARQSIEYDLSATSVSGLGFLIWSVLGGLFILQGSKFLGQNQVAVAVLLLYLISYFFIAVSSRIFESGMPLVVLAGLALTSWRRQIFISVLLLLGVLQWFMRLSAPMPF